MQAIELDQSTVDWLLDPVDPALNVKVLTELLDRPNDDPDVQAAHARIPEQPYVAAALQAFEKGTVWDHTFYIKYRGPSWTLAHLSEMGVSGDHPAIRRGIEYLLKTAKRGSRIQRREVVPFRDCPPRYWMHPYPCLTARMVTVLTRYGLAAHEVALGARGVLLHLHQPESGLDCQVIDYSLLPGCVMTVPEVVKCWLTLPPDERTDQEDAAIRDSIQLMLDVNLYRYVPAAAKEFATTTHKWKVDQVRELKHRWQDEGRLEERIAKDSWLKFSFPLSFNSDLLEVLLVVGEAHRQLSIPLDTGEGVIEDSLQRVLERRGNDGRWKMNGGLNGRMWANLDQKGKPSRWITYRALKAFHLFGLLERTSYV